MASTSIFSAGHITDNHPLIAQLNQLGDSDWLEAEPLIESCLEEGIYPWSNPQFLRYLHSTVRALVTLPRLHDKFMRGIIYARHITERMPVGVDDEISADFQALSEGKPLPAVKHGVGPRRKMLQGQHSCMWPSQQSALGFLHRAGGSLPWQELHKVRLQRKQEAAFRLGLMKRKVALRRKSA